ncbi:hypothetical protein F2Q69_00059197 [Brassica cretica]|uniref:Uncharacterized protein n=1 Tax=Brassica cretica TaxID=69181 RepID=A0A8S9REV4_BRACR|nr:hypothetical protein F2Q69_00059197 [Brassica cretica]
MDHITKQAVQLVRSDLLRVDRAHRPARRMAELDRPNDHLSYPPGWIDQTTTSAIHQLGGWPSWIDHVTSSAIHRARSTTRPVRPCAELDWSSSADC